MDQTAAAWDATHHRTDTGGDDSTAVTAEKWATQLDPTSAVDRAAAAEAAGRYGPEVDATLAGTYPGLLTAAPDARTAGNAGEAGALAQQEHERAEALTAESAARTLRGADVLGGLGGDEDNRPGGSSGHPGRRGRRAPRPPIRRGQPGRAGTR